MVIELNSLIAISMLVLVASILGMVIFEYYSYRKKLDSELTENYLYALELYYGAGKDINVLHEVGFYTHMEVLEQFIKENYRKHPKDLSLYSIGEWIKENNYGQIKNKL